MEITGKTAIPATTTAAPSGPKPTPNQSKWMAPAPGDSLTIRVQPGDTKFALARRYADDTNHDGKIGGAELTNFFSSLDKANGGSTSLKLGGTVNLPSDNVDYKVSIAIAVSKWLQEPTTSPDLAKADWDWTKMQVGGGPLDSWIVEVPTRDGARTEKFMVDENMADPDTEEYQPGFGVQLFSDWQKEFDASQ